MYALIPARGGSKGIPLKNIKLLNGKPLIYYSIDAALSAGLVPIVSTDNINIRDIAHGYGATVISRPEELATDTTKTIDVIKHFLKHYDDCTDCVLLQPTSPFRNYQDIKIAISMYIDGSYDSLYSCYENKFFIRDENGELVNYKERLPRQKLEPQYIENGAIYVFNRGIIDRKDFIFGRSGFYIMPSIRSIEIDTIDDWKMAEAIIDGSAI